MITIVTLNTTTMLSAVVIATRADARYTVITPDSGHQRVYDSSSLQSASLLLLCLQLDSTFSALLQLSFWERGWLDQKLSLHKDCGQVRAQQVQPSMR